MPFLVMFCAPSIVDISAPVSVIVAASEIFVPANSTTINIKTFKKVVFLM